MFPDEPNSTEIVRSRITFKKMIACFFGLKDISQQNPLQDRELLMLNGVQKFVCQKSSTKSGNTTKIVASFFIMTNHRTTFSCYVSNKKREGSDFHRLEKLLMPSKIILLIY